MSTILLTIISAIVAIFQPLYSIYSLMVVLSPLIRRRSVKNSRCEASNSEPKSVAIVLAVYKEDYESILRSLRSIVSQKYDPRLIRIVIVIEENDEATLNNVMEAIEHIKPTNRVDIVKANCRLRGGGKACALNTALRLINEDVYIVFDADDYVQDDYVAEAVCALQRATAVTTKVYRVGRGILANFTTLDTILWYDIVLYFIYWIGNYIPLSGEGLGIKTRYLKHIGGFPEKLTEDAYLAILLARDRKPITYLDTTYVVEKAPSGFKSYVDQRLRWIQGYYECLAATMSLLFRRELGFRDSIPLLISFISPILGIGTFLTHTLFIAYWISYFLGIKYMLVVLNTIFVPIVFYWGMFNLVVGNLAIIYQILYTMSDSMFQELVPYVLLLPLYWYMLGLLSILALFLPKEWRRTKR